ncbi:MAG: hypothetical protein IKI49_04625, partial [Oscillospiraceae bacterium]|nr:hypothetical protein [Oscillospiraceae bacterium]
FEIKEVAGSAAGYTYDDAVYTVTVEVTDGGSGTLKATKTITKTVNGVTTPATGIVFVNTYTPDTPYIDPPVKKVVIGNPPQKGTFTFVMRAESNTAGYAVKDMPMPYGSVNGEKRVTVLGAGEYEFGTFGFTKAGTYVYSVYEERGTEKGYTYDATRYTITVEVTEVNGRLVANMTIRDGDGNISGTCLFTNKYDEPDNPPDTPPDTPPDNPPDNPPDTPKTGDESRLNMWVSTMLGSFGMIVAVALFGRRKKRADDRNA